MMKDGRGCGWWCGEMADGGSIQRYVLEELPVQPEHFRDVLRCTYRRLRCNVVGKCLTFLRRVSHHLVQPRTGRARTA